MMFTPIINVLLAALPLVVLFSGMAMTPLLGAIVVVMLLAVPRAQLRTPAAALTNYRRLFALLGLMFGWALLTSIWSITPGYSIKSALGVVFLCVLGAVGFVYVVALEAPSSRLLKLAAGAVALGAVLILLEQLPGGGLIHYLYTASGKDFERFIGKNVNRGLCALSVLIWPVLFGFYRAGKVQLGWAVFALASLAIFSMHSLSAKLGLVVSFMVFMAVWKCPKLTSRAIVVILPLFLLSFPLLYVAMEHTVFAMPEVRLHLPPSALHRLDIWHELLYQVSQKPWFGWGMNTSRAMPLSDHALNVLHLTMPPLHPHSPSLQVLLEQGVIGLLLTVAAIGLLLREWVRQPTEDRVRYATGGALIVAYFATGVSSFGIWQTWWIATLWLAGILWRRMGQMSAW